MNGQNPVKILQIGMTSNIGGLETYLMQQFDCINSAKLKYDFVNITSENEIVFKDKILGSGSKIYNICSRHKNPLKHYWQWTNLLIDVSKEYKAIVLNSNSLEYVFPMFIAKIFGIPLRIMHSHNSGFEHPIGLKRKVLIFLNRMLMNFSVTDYFACSNSAGKWMFGNNKLFYVIHNAIDSDKFIFDIEKKNLVQEKLNLTGQFVIGHVGRFTYQKNHEFLIKIFNEFHKLNNDSKLLLVGNYVGDDFYWNKAKEYVVKLGLSDKVLFLGMRNDIPDLMQAMDCFVLPSKFEGLPLVGVEAQAAGLPCFFSDTITNELGITDLAHFISLDTAPAKWAEKILQNGNIYRKNMSKEISAAGYDIKTEIKKIEDFYTN